MDNQDKRLLSIFENKEKLKLFKPSGKIDGLEYPLDADVIKELKKLHQALRDDDNDYQIFHQKEAIAKLWIMLLEKSIKCLRYYDTREPFLQNTAAKAPKAYGIKELEEYYKEYTEFENVLYGTNKYYRDHVIHVFRTWLLGVFLLAKNDGAYLKEIDIREKGYSAKINNTEKLCIWTIIALTHDLGYPLQKANSVIDVTRRMVGTFVTSPDISVDFSFHGVQNYMNDFIVRLMSSKMKQKNNSPYVVEGSNSSPTDNAEKEEKEYVARLQPKYYFKFQKSLEQNCHGILSTLIIYKLLTYFLESDYNINEDYTFEEEDCRQFYIRREILRAIASHTCDDVYQLYMGSFSFLLRICDDTQEWGRKNITELYIDEGREYNLKDVELTTSEATQERKCRIEEEIVVSKDESIFELQKRFQKQATTYVTIFRDGQDTASRDFSFIRTLIVKCQQIEVVFKLEIDKESASKMTGEIKYTSDAEKNQNYGDGIRKNFSGCISMDIYNEDGQSAKDEDPACWRKAELLFCLES